MNCGGEPRIYTDERGSGEKQSRCSADLFCRSAVLLGHTSESRGPTEQVRATLLDSMTTLNWQTACIENKDKGFEVW